MHRLSKMVQILKSRPNPGRFLVARTLVRLNLSPLLLIRRHGYRLRFFPTSLSSSLWELGPEERREDEELLRQVLRTGDVYVDIGANVGTLTIVGRQAVGESGQVIAVEAHPRTFNYLKENLKLNGVVAELYNCAVGAEAGQLLFSDVSSDDQNKIVFDTHNALEVQVQPLDVLLASVGRVRLLKIDVEGFEYQVLRGAQKLLQRCDCLYLESWDRHAERYGYTVPQLIEQLRRHRYSVYSLGHGAPRAVDADHHSPKCEDLLAIAADCSDRDAILGLLSS